MQSERSQKKQMPRDWLPIRGRQPSIKDAFDESIPEWPPEGTGPGPPEAPDDQPVSGESAPPERAAGAPAPENLKFRNPEDPAEAEFGTAEDQPVSEVSTLTERLRESSTLTERPGGAPAPSSTSKKKKKVKKKRTCMDLPTGLEALLGRSPLAERSGGTQSPDEVTALFARRRAFGEADSVVTYVIDEAVAEAAPDPRGRCQAPPSEP